MKRFNPNDRKQRERLFQAINLSEKRLAPFRKNRLTVIKQYVGIRFSDDGAKERVLMNMLELAINIYQRQLVATNPRVLITTKRPKIKPYAASLTIAANDELVDMHFKDTLDKIVMDSLFCVGVAKSGICSGGTVEIEGFMHEVGRTYIDNILLDNWFVDMSATEYEKIKFVGDIYELPYEYVMENKAYKNTADLKPEEYKPYHPSGDAKAASVTQGSGYYTEGYKDSLWLRNVWLPMDRLLITCVADNSDRKPLQVIDWDGPQHGPYRTLSYTRVPDSVMPLPPVANWTDMHMLLNGMMRKLARQAERQKKITLYPSAAAGDAERMNKADDGETVRVDAPERINEVNFGGIAPENLAFLLQIKGVIDELWGNLPALGGLSPQSPTATQDQMLMQSASKRLDAMQDKVIDFTSEAVSDILEYMHTDPLYQRMIEKKIKGTDIAIQTMFTPSDHKVNFKDLDISIEPYSLQNPTPASRLNTMVGLVQNIIIPLMPMLEARGGEFDMQGFLRKFAEYTNMTELDDLVTFSEPMEQEGGGLERPRQSPVTTRTNVRENRPGATRAGNDGALMQSLMSKMMPGVQPNEAAAAGRST